MLCSRKDTTLKRLYTQSHIVCKNCFFSPTLTCMCLLRFESSVRPNLCPLASSDEIANDQSATLARLCYIQKLTRYSGNSNKSCTQVTASLSLPAVRSVSKEKRLQTVFRKQIVWCLGFFSLLSFDGEPLIINVDRTVLS